MVEIPDPETLPTETDHTSVEWAMRLAVVFVGDASEGFDFDLLERMVQAIRNEAAREVCTEVERTVAVKCWREP